MHTIISIVCFFIFSGIVWSSSDFTDYSTEDVFVPVQCDSVAKPGDHLLLEYSIVLANGTITSYLKAPSQLYHILLDKSVRNQRYLRVFCIVNNSNDCRLYTYYRRIYQSLLP